jgi:O-methyltransferase
MYGKEKLEAIVKKHPDSFPAVGLLKHFDAFIGLHDAIGGKWIHGWGSYLFDGLTYSYNERCLRKQEELYRYAMSATHALEIGVYTGHSLLILLVANPKLKITAIDIDDTIAKPAIDYLNDVFGNRIEFIHADAVEGMRALPSNTFDFIHIDADHVDSAVHAQFLASIRLAKKNATVVFDDYDAVRTSIDGFISQGYLDHVITPICLWRNCVTRLAAKTKEETIINVSKRYSACSSDRLGFNIYAVKDVNLRGIDGDIVEVGVYKGGSMLAMILTNGMTSIIDRQYYLYDTFEEAMPPSTHAADDLIRRSEVIKSIAPLSEVKSNLDRHTTSAQQANIKYIVGNIMKNTVYPEKIAVLRLDTDFYDSTAFELANFYDRVSPGGYVIIDDYGHWRGCKKAVDEFLVAHPELKLHKIDYTGVYFMKPKASE